VLTSLFVYKGKITDLYKKYETYINIFLKFVLAILFFNYITKEIGTYDILTKLPIRLILSLICAFVSPAVFVLIAVIVILLHLFKMSMLLALLALVIFSIYYFLYLKFTPKHGLLMIAIPVFAPFHLHYAVPLLAGLKYTPFTIIPVGMSVVMSKLITYIKEAAPMITSNTDIEGTLAAYTVVIDSLMSDKEVQLFFIIFTLVILLTYVVSRLPIDYSWYISIGVGTLANMIGLLAGAKVLNVDISGVGVILGSLISGIAIAALQFFICCIDYKRKEFVQFEDDDYYYYVRAIPKINVSAPEVKIRKITSEPKEAAAKPAKAAEPVKAAKNKESEKRKPVNRKTDFSTEDMDTGYDEIDYDDLE